MISDKGVHSHIQHTKNIIETIQKQNIHQEIILHLILDGRDASPQSACSYIENIKKNISFTNISIGSIHGRFYAMDRDNNQERTDLSGSLL